MKEKIKAFIMIVILLILGWGFFEVLSGCKPAINPDTGEVLYEPDYNLLGRNAAYSYFIIKDLNPDIAYAYETAFSIAQGIGGFNSYSDLSFMVSTLIAREIVHDDIQIQNQRRALAMMVVEDVIHTIRIYLGEKPLPQDLQEAIEEFIAGAQYVVNTLNAQEKMKALGLKE